MTEFRSSALKTASAWCGGKFGREISKNLRVEGLPKEDFRA
jgi:hypothetical protein